MSWAISTRNITSIRSFAGAKKHWEEMTPWRNQYASWRQLGNRRAYHMRLVKLDQEEGYECVLYQTAVVTYYANGTVQLRGHDSASTNSFAWCVTPDGVSSTSHHGRMFWKVATDDGPAYFEDDRGMLIGPTGKPGVWQLLKEPVKHIERKYDPKKGAATRKALKPFMDWDAMARRISGKRPPDFLRVTTNQVEALILDPTNIELWPTIAEHMAKPSQLLDEAYVLSGAHYEVLAPMNRLPRIRS